MSTYNIDHGNYGVAPADKATAVAVVENLSPGEKVTIENTTVEHEYDVFYGGTDTDRWGDRPNFTQHQVIKATNHREAVIKSLRCNYSDGTRYLVVGSEKRTWGTEKTGRVFEINSCLAGDLRIVHTYTHTNRGGYDAWWDGYPGRYREPYTLPTKYYRVDEVGRA